MREDRKRREALKEEERKQEEEREKERIKLEVWCVNMYSGLTVVE